VFRRDASTVARYFKAAATKALNSGWPVLGVRSEFWVELHAHEERMARKLHHLGRFSLGVRAVTL